MEMEGLEFEGETSWKNVWQTWLEREGAREDWQQLAIKKGFESWEEWRDAWVKNFDAQKRRWFRYTVPNPLVTVPHFRIGPTQGWQQHFPESEYNQRTFADLVERVPYDENEKVQGILKDFPQPTEFIGIVMPDKKIITLIEGHHRATALAFADKKQRELVFEHLPTIALTFFEEGEEKMLDTMLARGSGKQ